MFTFFSVVRVRRAKTQ